MSASLPSPKSDAIRGADAPKSQPLAAKAIRRKRIGAWVAVLAWSGVIWQLGGEDFSAPETQSTLIEILAWLGIDLAPQAQIAILTVVRKAAHCVEYGIFAVLVWIAVRLSSAGATGARQVTKRLWPAFTALGFVLALAIADETRQASSVSRTGSPYDVLLDLSGGLIAIAAVALLDRLNRTTAPNALVND